MLWYLVYIVCVQYIWCAYSIFIYVILQKVYSVFHRVCMEDVYSIYIVLVYVYKLYTIYCKVYYIYTIKTNKNKRMNVYIYIFI